MIPIIWFTFCFTIFLASVNATETSTASASTSTSTSASTSTSPSPSPSPPPSSSPSPPTTSPPSTQSYVRNLNIDNMDQSIQYDADHGRDTMIHFYQPWSGHCKHLNITWEKFATEMNNTLTIARVNSIRDEQLSIRLDIRGGPTVCLFRKGMVYEYESNRTLDGLKSWIQHQGWTNSSRIRPYSTCIPPHTITSITTTDTDMKYPDAYEPRSHVHGGIYPGPERSSYILLCNSLTNCECRKLEYVWARVANNLKDLNMTWVAHINTAEDRHIKAATQLGITSFPSIAYIHQGRIYHYDGIILHSQDQIFEFIDWIRNDDWMFSPNAPFSSSIYSYIPPQPCHSKHSESFIMHIINKIHVTCGEVWKDVQLVWAHHVISSYIIFTAGGILSLSLTAMLTWLCGNTSTSAQDAPNTTSIAIANQTESGSATTLTTAASTSIQTDTAKEWSKAP